MKPEFLYHRKDGRDKLHAQGMSLFEMAAEPAYLARKIYATVKKCDPVTAEAFRNAVIQLVTDPVTWDISSYPMQDIK